MAMTTFQTEERAREIEKLGRPRDGGAYAKREAAQNRRQAIDFLTRVPRAWTVEELTTEADKLIAYLEGRS